MHRLLTVGLFLGSYGVARGLAFLGPLLLPRLLAADVYGGVELALSIAALLGSAVGLGVPQAVPRLKLVLGHTRVIDLLALTFLLGAGPLLAASFLIAEAGIVWIAALALALAALYGAQYALSFWARVEGYRLLSTWVDNGVLVLIGVVTVGLLLLPVPPPGAALLLTGVWAMGAAVLLTGGGLLLRYRVPDLWPHWRRAVREGGALLATALILAAFAAAPRLLAGRFLPLAEVGALALAARFCLLLLVMHQLLMTWHFRNLYTWPAARCDRLFAGLLLLLGGLGCALTLAWPWAAPFIAPDYPPLPRLTLALVAGQTVLWIALALFESLLGRQGLGRSAAPRLAVVGLAAWGAIEALLWEGAATPERIALLAGGVLAAGVATQWLLLRRSGLPLPWAGVALAAAGLPPLLALSL